MLIRNQRNKLHKKKGCGFIRETRRETELCFACWLISIFKNKLLLPHIFSFFFNLEEGICFSVFLPLCFTSPCKTLVPSSGCWEDNRCYHMWQLPFISMRSWTCLKNSRSAGKEWGANLPFRVPGVDPAENIKTDWLFRLCSVMCMYVFKVFQETRYRNKNFFRCSDGYYLFTKNETFSLV